MQTLQFDSTKPFNDLAKRALRAAVIEVFGHVRVQMEYVKGAALHFGVTAPSVRDITLSDNEARTHRELVAAIRACLPRIPCTPWLGSVPDELVLYLDIETHEAEKRWDMPLNEFFRLGQYAWGPTGDVHLTDDIFHLMQQIERARGIIAHNGHAFDFSVLLGDAALADERLFDTMVFANQAFAAPHMFTKRDGSTVITDKTPMNVAAWLGLDNLAFQLELEGKEGDLKALAKEFGGFGLIPTDDPRFRAYAEQDIRTLQLLTTELVTIHAPTSYDWDEQRKAAINAQMSRNGVRIDVAGAHQRIAELTERKETLLADLHANYNFPTTGKMPWRTKAGKQAILDILASFGITPENTDPEIWPMLKTGPSLGGKVLLEITEGTPAEDTGLVLAELQGQRWLAQTALDHLYADGLCHPDFTAWQRSGRVSVRNPGLTIWGERNPRDKAYIIAKPGNVLLEADYSNCFSPDARALTSDLRWVKVAELKANDELIGFDDDIHYRRCKMRRSTITHVKETLVSTVEITMSSGTKLVCSEDHLWPAKTTAASTRSWVRAKDLTDSHVLMRWAGEPWTEATDFESGWVSGLFDGEGWVSEPVAANNRTAHVGVAQNRGPVWDRVSSWLNENAFCYTLAERGNLKQAIVTGTPNKLRLLGMLRPTRLLDKAPFIWEGRAAFHRSQTNRADRVVSIRHLGVQKLISVGTTTHTLIVEGYLTHNCDQRVVAALSGDPEYAKRFLPGADGHEITGRLVYGDAVYDSDPKTYRQTAKILSHSWSYGCGPTKLAKTAKTNYDTALRFVKAMQRAYPILTAWQNQVREDAKKGFIVNYFGRRVHIDKGMEYTQAPAMHGQSMTTEILYRGLIRLFTTRPDMARYLICVVHDAVLFDLPPERVSSAKLDIRKSMETTINEIHFPVSFGNPASNWQDARHV